MIVDIERGDYTRTDHFGRNFMFFRDIVKNCPKGMNYFQIGAENFSPGYLEIDDLDNGESESCTSIDGIIEEGGGFEEEHLFKISDLYTCNMKVIESL